MFRGEIVEVQDSGLWVKLQVLRPRVKYARFLCLKHFDQDLHMCGEMPAYRNLSLWGSGYGYGFMAQQQI